MVQFWDERSGPVLTEAIGALEERTSAELVIAVRPSSSSFLHINMAVGIVWAVAMLALLVFGPWPVAWVYLLIDPIIFGVLGAFAASRVPALQRVLSRAAVRSAHVRRAAQAEFLERGVHNTRERTGILFYVSLVERTSAVIIDSGIELAIPSDDWQAVCDSLQELTERGACATELGKAIGAMADLLEVHLPKRHDDVNELGDEVQR